MPTVTIRYPAADGERFAAAPRNLGDTIPITVGAPWPVVHACLIAAEVVDDGAALSLTLEMSDDDAVLVANLLYAA